MIVILGSRNPIKYRFKRAENNGKESKDAKYPPNRFQHGPNLPQIYLRFKVLLLGCAQCLIDVRP
jgi:hypothetical protein